MPSVSYASLLEQAKDIYPGIRIGRPGRARPYWWIYPPAQVLRLKYAIAAQGSHHVKPGPAILIGNHLSLVDPVLVGVSHRWRLTFFTKVEVFERPGAAFFRGTGQIPLRRGDEASTRWALAMSEHALERGGKLAVYPEGTRSPDGVSMHRLHRRVLIPVLQANPGIPVHVMSIAYPRTRGWRQQVDLRFSPALSLDPETMSANDLTDAVTKALLALGGMPYVHRFGQALKPTD